MKILQLLFYFVVLAMPMSATTTDPLVTAFRQFIETACQQANHNLSLAYSIPDVKEKLNKGSDGWVNLQNGYLENLKNMSRNGDCTVTRNGNTITAVADIFIQDMQFSFDFSSNSKKFSDASGCIYGNIESVYCVLTVVANITNTSAVTATAQSLQFHGLGSLSVADASISTINNVDFVNDITTAVGNLLRGNTLPSLETEVVRIINGILKKLTLKMNLTSTANPTNIYHYFNGILTKISRSRNADNIHGTRMADKYHKSQSTGRIRIALSKKRGDNYVSRREDRLDLSCRLSRRVKHVNTIPSDNLIFNISKGSLPNTINPISKDYLSDEFNNLFDTLLTRTDRQLEVEHFDPYDMTGGEEELYQWTDGSVTLKRGRVSGMGAILLSSDPTLHMNGNDATVSAILNFTDVSFVFNYVANSVSFPNVSASVLGNITQMAGNLTIVADLTNATAVTAQLKSFHLLDTAFLCSDLAIDVHHSKTVSQIFTSEVSDAVISAFKDSVGLQLQDRATTILRRAVTMVHQDMSSIITTTSSTIPRSSTVTSHATDLHTHSTVHTAQPHKPSTHANTSVPTSSTYLPTHVSTTHTHNKFTVPPGNTSYNISTISSSSNHKPNSSSSLAGIEVWFKMLVVLVTHTLIKHEIY